MASGNPVLSSLLMALGVILVFWGLTLALGFSAAGMIASMAVIAALLYAGAVWFAPLAIPSLHRTGAIPVIVFDRRLSIVSGGRPGQPITAAFPERARAQIERHCEAALAGQGSQFAFADGETILTFDAAPVRMADGTILYGILVAGAPFAVSIAAAHATSIVGARQT